MAQIKPASMQKRQRTNALAPAILCFLLLGLAFYFQKFRQQRQHYQTLRKLQQAAIDTHGAQFNLAPAATSHAGHTQQPALPSFAEHLAVMPNFLPAAAFQQLHDEIRQLGQTERSYLPIHKQGGTVAYETLHHHAPKVIAFFNHADLHNLLSRLIGETVYPTPIEDQSACSLLYYTQPGDHINWHYDHNFYNGRHFTVLLPIVNQQNDAPEQLSSAQLMVKTGDHEQVIAGKPNTLIVFEGAKVLHKVTRLAPNETRIILSMTFATTPQASFVTAVARRIKDVAFFGIRALWT